MTEALQLLPQTINVNQVLSRVQQHTGHGREGTRR